MNESATEVLIVGAGPTGLMLACDLLRRGVPFRIVDRSPTPSQDSRAVGMQARTLELFDDLGLVEDFLNQGVLIEAVSTYLEGKQSNRFELATQPTEDIPHPYLLVIEQHVTEALLLTHLRSRGVEVERARTLKRLKNDPSQVQCWLDTPSGEEHVRSNFLVGCDGAGSTVRRLTGIKMFGANSATAYRLADVEIAWDMPEREVLRFPGKDWELVAMPLYGPRRYRLNLWEPAPYRTGSEEIEFGALDAPPTLEFMQNRVNELVPGSAKLENPRSLMSYRTGFGVAERYSQGRVFLAGDSAHLIPQSAAQGMNLGLQDAYNLGWKLALVVNESAPIELLDSYQKERRPLVVQALRPVDKGGASAGRALHLESPEALDRWSQIHLNYRGSSTQIQSLAEGAVHPGDRAPDGALASHGERTTLHSLLNGERHHLLAFCDQEDESLKHLLDVVETTYGPLIEIHSVGLSAEADTDVAGALRRIYGAQHGDLVLIRPDRFVGVRASADRYPEFLHHLASNFIPKLEEVMS